MTEIINIQDNYVTVKGPFGVINQGNGYAIVDVHTGQCIARNISSFTDCLKAIDHLLEQLEDGPGGSGGGSGPTKTGPGPDDRLKIAIAGLKPDVQRLIRKYAPETVSVDKSTNFMSQSRYKCFDQNGKVLGRVRGKSGDRYWQYGDLSDSKHY